MLGTSITIKNTNFNKKSRWLELCGWCLGAQLQLKIPILIRNRGGWSSKKIQLQLKILILIRNRGGWEPSPGTKAGKSITHPDLERPPPQNESFGSTNSSRSKPQPLPCTGQVRSGQVRSGQVRSGQVRSGQVRSGQDMWFRLIII